MNDRCLFKAKSSDTGEWVIGSYHHQTDYYGEKFDEHYIIVGSETNTEGYGEHYIIDKSTLCQCTGLKDKNGTLIWENDIVRCIDRNSEAEFIAVVEFGNPNGFYSWGYQLRHIKGDKPNLDILLWVEMEETGATIEVIGNNFDNCDI